MDIVKQEVLDSIDNISLITMESTLAVYDSLSREYDKISYMMDYAIENGMDTSELFQEGKIMDKASGKNTDDGLIKKIVLFLPRLLIAIVESIRDTFKKDYKTKLDENNKAAQNNLSNASEDEITNVAETIDKQTNGEVKMDPKTKKLTLGQRIGRVWKKAGLFAGISGILIRLRKEIKSPDTDYKKFAGELKKILDGDKGIDEYTIAVGVDAFNTGLKDLAIAGTTVAGACEGLNGFLEKKIKAELEKDGGDPQKVQDIKDLIDQIQRIAGYTTAAAVTGKIGLKVSNILGNHDVYFPWSKKGKAKARSVNEKRVSKALEPFLYSEEHDKINALEDQIKDLERQARAASTKDAKKEALHNEIMKKRQDLEKLKKLVDQIDENARMNEERRNAEEEKYEQTGEVTTPRQRKKQIKRDKKDAKIRRKMAQPDNINY